MSSFRKSLDPSLFALSGGRSVDGELQRPILTATPTSGIHIASSINYAASDMHLVVGPAVPPVLLAASVMRPFPLLPAGQALSSALWSVFRAGPPS